MAETHVIDRDNPDVSHETSDVSFGGVVWFGIVLAVLAIVIHVVLAILFWQWHGQAESSHPDISPLAEEEQSQPVPTPRLEGFETPDAIVARRNSIKIPPDDADEVIRRLVGKLPVKQSPAAESRRPSNANSGRDREEIKP